MTPSLLVTQREDRVDAAGAARRDQAGRGRHQREQEPSRSRPRDRGCRCHRAASTRTCRGRRPPGRRWPGRSPAAAALPSSPARSPARLRAERQADAELLRAPRDDERHDAVEADRREQRREQAEAGRQQRNQAVGQQRLVELRLRASSADRPASPRRAACTSLRTRLYALADAVWRPHVERPRCSCPSSARTPAAGRPRAALRRASRRRRR